MNGQYEREANFWVNTSDTPEETRYRVLAVILSSVPEGTIFVGDKTILIPDYVQF